MVIFRRCTAWAVLNARCPVRIHLDIRTRQKQSRTPEPTIVNIRGAV